MRADPLVTTLVRELLPLEPADCVTARELAAMATATLCRRVHLRRIGEAVAALRREGVHVWSGSGKGGLRGYRIAASDASLSDCAREHQRRALESLRMAARLRRMSVREVAKQIGLFG